MDTIPATWSKVVFDDRLRRSSQVLSVIEKQVCIFGGELLPRQPVDNNLDVFRLDLGTPTVTTMALDTAPSPRVGSASTTLNGKMYLFSGRGGPDMTPIEENGTLWVYDPEKSSWSTISPIDPSHPYPAARSYHCLANNGFDTIFVHAGCPANGRLSDLWAFTVTIRQWVQLPSAPDPPRGGTSIALSGVELFRMNGFDGKTEQGGNLDIFNLAEGSWSTRPYTADGVSGPAPRSVSALLPVNIFGKKYLVTLFGERDPSSLGHAGAGKMLGDAWAYEIESGKWIKINAEADSLEGLPEPRGWFAADLLIGEPTVQGVLVHGGLGESNERLGDVWLLYF
ncbi:galactose oxidase [Lepidopterella palustris CBS 459.81]|uniref:Galactose oxidase n=1 Tax=Lepidopterella palustris CBS 459.81 TaxID=1314670 RepID=A0A8E2EIR8_9PEZI|nr:galactose oxidase [Lepidopterella palustris CBS 459.81]